MNVAVPAMKAIVSAPATYPLTAELMLSSERRSRSRCSGGREAD